MITHTHTHTETVLETQHRIWTQTAWRSFQSGSYLQQEHTYRHTECEEGRRFVIFKGAITPTEWASVTCTHSERTNTHTHTHRALTYSTQPRLACSVTMVTTSLWLHNIYIHCYRSKPQIHKMLCPHSSLTPICKVYCSAIYRNVFL